MNKKLFILALVGVLLTACQNDNDFLGNEVKITSGSDTRASGTAWQKRDSIGIFMVKNEDQSVLSKNIEHKNVSEDGAIAVFEPANINEKLYYPGNAAVDLLGYYPYQKGITGYNYKLDVRDQTNLPAIDLITARKNNIRRTNSMQDLKFGHALSKIKLTIKAGIGMTYQDVADAKVSIAGVCTKADYDLSNGGVKALEIGKVDVPQSNCIVEAILVPQTDISGFLFMIDVYTRTFTVAVPNSIKAFEGGMEYCYTITLNRTGLVTITSTSIGEWKIGTVNYDLPVDISKVYIPSVESFWMGSPSNESDRQNTETRHQVKLTKGFYMSQYEITTAQYADFLNHMAGYISGDFVQIKKADETVVNVCSSLYPNLIPTFSNGTWSGTNKPMSCVTWYGAKAFAEWFGGDLPTEAQWEYACRAGRYTPWSFDSTITNLDGVCVYRDSQFTQLTEVGTRRPNDWWLYDMHGNVPEWCLDYWDGVTPYGDQPVEDPKGLDSGTKRVLRGGGFYDTAALCRSASRSSELPNETQIRRGMDPVQGFGFRIVWNDRN